MGALVVKLLWVVVGLLLLLVHDLVSNLEDDAGGLLAEKESLAELTTIVFLVEDRADLSEGLDGIKCHIEHGVGLTLVHVGHHHLHWGSHVDIGLHLWVDLDRLARVILELILTCEEHTSLGAAEELGVKRAN